MAKRLGFDLHSLPAQIILSYLVLVLLMASAAGLPVILLARDQLDRQAWAQVDQGSRAAERGQRAGGADGATSYAAGPDGGRGARGVG
jgi:hypothetical protein